MAKCEKCGKEYLDGTEHVCALPGEQKSEGISSQEEKQIPVDETQQQKAEIEEKKEVENHGKKESDNEESS